ncbi:TPA: acyltransferase [Klebsiella aerogenes]|nr:acyltransferase 3 [Klebsiella aerogenes]HBT2488822.1 acyltransferase [Klebsiella aerogenes]HBT2497301.1 acyltransferase [Klebsiella aerogenes]
MILNIYNHTPLGKLMSQTKNWTPELDGLRGYASLWVVLGHICNLTNCNIPILRTPSIGVDVFILLSGYLMAKNYTERQHFEPWDSPKTITTFWLRRFFRIAPLFYILLIVALFFGETFGHYRDLISSMWIETQADTDKYDDTSFINLFTHLSFMFGFLPYFSARTAIPDWSIGLEMQYYAIFPFIMLLIMKFGYIRSSVVLMASCVVLSYLAPDYFSAFPRPSMILFKLPLFISGMLIYKSVMENKKHFILIALLAPLFSWFMGYFMSRGLIIIEMFIIIALATLLMKHREKTLINRVAFTGKWFLSIRLSRFLGEVSYSVYLLHLMIVIPTIGILVQYPWFAELAPTLRFLLVTVTVLPVTYFLSTLLFKYVEQKGIIFGKKLIKSRSVKTSEIA